MNPSDLLKVTDHGLYCPPGNFYIDPWKPVERAVITHGHGDHLHYGCGSYLTAVSGVPILQARLDKAASIQGEPYGSKLSIGEVELSLHPAGHILGSAQVLVSYRGFRLVVSGDYKVESDPTCEPFEPVRCDYFITESTFGLPIFRWRRSAEVFSEIEKWRDKNSAEGLNSVIFAYALGKAQRLTAHLAPPIFVHGSIRKFIEIYQAQGVAIRNPVAEYQGLKNLLVLAPPSAAGTPWLKKFEPYRTAFASGWMSSRGQRRRRGVDAGFVISDHCDWDSLLYAIGESGASSIGITHGSGEALGRYLREERGLDAFTLPTRWEVEE
jgi:putative mRNA 3-end processing factor